jgi:N-acetylneuraminic acid mutarotase
MERISFALRLCRTSLPSLAGIFLALSAGSGYGQTGKWTSLPDTAKVLPREECGFAQAGGKFYLMGGRSAVSVQEYDPVLKSWRDLKKTPDTLNHFQALSHAGLIYIIGAFNEGPHYPNEQPAPVVHIYDPLSDTWVIGATIPTARRRGSAGLVEYKNKFYVVLGNKLGHTANGVTLLDEFDPTTNVWTTLPDGPRTRDHFQAAVVNGKIYAVGGRMSGKTPSIYTTLEKVDVYDIEAKTWTTLPSTSDLVTPRSGGIVAALGSDILYAGGSNPEVNKISAYDSTKAFNTTTGIWRNLAPMVRGRQVTGGFIFNSGLYVASGSGGISGSPTLRSMEAFFMGDAVAPTADALVAGKLLPADTSFNFGIVPNGQASSKSFLLKHAAGNQGVLISALKISGDPAFQLKTQVTAPYLVRPGESSPVEISFTSGGAAPAASYLEVTYAVPPGASLKVPLDANRTPSAIVIRNSRSNRLPNGQASSESPLYQRASESDHWNALGKLKVIRETAK